MKNPLLYPALDDDNKRLQDRMFRVEITEQLHFAACAKQIGCGLKNPLDNSPGAPRYPAYYH